MRTLSPHAAPSGTQPCTVVEADSPDVSIRACTGELAALAELSAGGGALLTKRRGMATLQAGNLHDVLITPHSCCCTELPRSSFWACQSVPSSPCHACAHLMSCVTAAVDITGGHGMCCGNHGTVLTLRGGGLVAREASMPTSGGTDSDSGQPSQSSVLSEGRGEEHAVQGVDQTVAG